MPDVSFWSRLRQARVFQLLAIYAGASWVILQVTSLFIGNLGLPQWAMPAAIILLLIGLVILCATAWVQSHPLTPHRAAAGDVPRARAVALGEMKDSLAAGRLPHLTWGRAILGGAFAFALLFGVAGLYVVIQDRGRSFTPEEARAEDAAPGIAVVPFSVRGAGLEVWREGMVDLLSTGLDGAAGLRAIDSRTVLARWGERVPGDAAADLATTLAVARETGARYAVVGSAVAIGPSVRLVADVYDAGSEKSLGQGTVEGPPDSVLHLVDQLAVEVLRVILQKGGGELPRIDLASVTTASYPALKAYLEGEVLFRRAAFEEAITAYERAIAADSTFALAYYRLGLSYAWIQSIESERQREAVERALALTDRLPEREAVLVRSLWSLINFELDGLEPLREAVRKYPDDAEAWYLLGDTYYHLRSRALVTGEDAEAAFTRAMELDPRFAPYQIHLMNLALSLHADSVRAARRIDSYGRLAPTSVHLQLARIAQALAFGEAARKAQARAALDTLEWS
ncbi:MAG: tetratricopeptide repeat protein, partial [Gemmatimonadota bacterium]